MFIRKPKPWNLPEREATPETVYRNRREILASLAFAGAIQGATRNPDFNPPNLPITEEWAATSYNNYYEFTTDKQQVKAQAVRFKPRPWTVEITGLCAKPAKLAIETIEKEMPIEERVYRHRCVEAWAMVAPWMGFPLAELLKRAEPKAEAKFVRFTSVNRPSEMSGLLYSGSYNWPYNEALRIDEAMNPLAFMVTGMYGKPLPNQNGAPLRLALPWKYGFKGPKAIVKIEFLAKRPSTFWNSYNAQEYGFYSNVNPKRPHPRWSQAVEQVIPNMERRATLPYNGYEKWVASMYNGSEI
jgi:methionine sulfoxide reductase catalytic subunit